MVRANCSIAQGKVSPAGHGLSIYFRRGKYVPKLSHISSRQTPEKLLTGFTDKKSITSLPNVFCCENRLYNSITNSQV